jgi:ABC-type glutathione transport system ATPase component
MTRAPWVAHFGFTATPFRKTIAASQLCERASHQEAVARIRFCIAEALLGVLVGEVGVGKTVALRAAVSQLDPAAHHIVYVMICGQSPSLMTKWSASRDYPHIAIYASPKGAVIFDHPHKSPTRRSAHAGCT